jgi:hypothetical protein
LFLKFQGFKMKTIKNLTDREKEGDYLFGIDHIKPIEAKQNRVYWTKQDARKAQEIQMDRNYWTNLDNKKYR